MNHLKEQIKRILQGAALLMVLGTVLPAMATDYVFVYNNNNYLSVNANGQVANSTSLTAGCVWTCVESTTDSEHDDFSSLDNTDKYLYTIVNGTKYWLRKSGNSISRTRSRKSTAVSTVRRNTTPRKSAADPKKSGLPHQAFFCLMRQFLRRFFLDNQEAILALNTLSPYQLSAPPQRLFTMARANYSPVEPQ